jgi:DNA repair protein RecO (recombination protein O)
VSPSAIAPHETTTPAIVIRARAFGESDKIVTFLTRDLGKLSGIAKGAKRSKRRFVNVLEPFTDVNLRVRQRSTSELAFVLACELVEAHRSFAQDLVKFACASYVLELTDHMIRGREAGSEVYELVRGALDLLDRGGHAPGVLRAFELHLLRSTGYEPVLDRCRRCDARLDAAHAYVQPARGGVLCAACRGDGRTSVVARATLDRLLDLQRACFDGTDTGAFALPPAVATEARALLRSFFAATLTAPLASERLLETISQS